MVLSDFLAGVLAGVLDGADESDELELDDESFDELELDDDSLEELESEEEFSEGELDGFLPRESFR